MKLSSTETDLIGKWELVNGSVQWDATCERIRVAHDRVFGKIAGTNWAVLYRDPEDGRYWELTYPMGEMHRAVRQG